MNPSDVPVKTVAGNLEVSRRAHKLSSRVRSLLIVIHGTDTVAELTRNFHAFGDGLIRVLVEISAEIDQRIVNGSANVDRGLSAAASHQPAEAAPERASK